MEVEAAKDIVDLASPPTALEPAGPGQVTALADLLLLPSAPSEIGPLRAGQFRLSAPVLDSSRFLADV